MQGKRGEEMIPKFRAKKDDISDSSFVYGLLIYDEKGNPRILTDIKNMLFTTCIKGKKAYDEDCYNCEEFKEERCLGDKTILEEEAFSSKKKTLGKRTSHQLSADSLGEIILDEMKTMCFRDEIKTKKRGREPKSLKDYKENFHFLWEDEDMLLAIQKATETTAKEIFDELEKSSMGLIETPHKKDCSCNYCFTFNWIKHDLKRIKQKFVKGGKE